MPLKHIRARLRNYIRDARLAQQTARLINTRERARGRAEAYGVALRMIATKQED